MHVDLAARLSRKRTGGVDMISESVVEEEPSLLSSKDGAALSKYTFKSLFYFSGWTPLL